VYRGIYTLSRRDKLLPSSTVTANLRSGNRIASAVLDEPLLAGWTPPAPVSATPRIERLDFLPSVASANPPALQMVLFGSPGGRATARIAGTQGRILLDEARPGEYRGSYVLQPDERLKSGTEVIANLRIDDRRVSTTFALPVSASGSPPRDVRPVAGPGWCPDCGVVAAVNRVEMNGDGNYVGALTGGVVGAVLGNQIGKGDGRTAAQIAGAIGGALAGREIQRRNNRTEHFEVVVDMRNGGQQTVSYSTPPEFAVGDRVRLANGNLVRDR
ncbi:MAG: glycine zipper 2TM domain-containing protein, partial [Burkholderiaceae bacterium]